MFGKNNTRWFLILALLMLGLRVGYKYYRSQQKLDYETQMANATARQQSLIERIQADQDAQRARGAVVVVADSAVIAADTTLSAK
ncbi:hypothetical protein GCM10022409_17710 [Hymenobacter glaciei]|uniref:Uncharacterized protein n=1 Tax=Hymenobacter glaciei TaxID=877209 RepID=A0ABP7U051_9BACT